MWIDCTEPRFFFLGDLELKAHRNAYGESMTEAQEQQLERKLTKLCEVT